MAVRIAHGLFRLWIVFSMLWIAGVAVETWSTFPVDKWVIPSTANVAPGHRPTECTGKSDDECFNILKRLGKNPFDAFDPEPHPDEFILPSDLDANAYKACMGSGKSAKDCAAALKPPFDASKPYQEVRSSERWTAVRFAAMLAIVPPIIILGFGSALGWAFKGFRTSP